MLSFRQSVYIFIIILAIIRFLAIHYLFPTVSYQDHVLIFIFGVVIMVFLFEVFFILHKFFNKKIPFERRVLFRLFLQTLISLAILLLVGFVSLHYLPYFLPTVNFTLIDIPLVYVLGVVLAIALNMGFFGQYFFEAWKSKIIENERLAKEKALAEQQQTLLQFHNLQNQLNPHFLFNSITSLSGLIYENQDLASDFVKQLAKVYRYVLQHQNNELVSIFQELSFIENYIFLLKTRFENSLFYSINIEKIYLEKKIVPVTLQVLIENVIKHNIFTENKPLYLEIYTENNFLCVKNNRQIKKHVENSNKIGLINLKKLYHHLSNVKVEIIENQEIFLVKLPLL